MMCCYIVNNGIDQCNVGFLRCSFTRHDDYYGVLIQVVVVISPDDSDAIRSAKFHCFHGWTNAAVTGMNKHHPSSCDENHSKKKKKYLFIK